jgi:hypothetical protein
VTTSKYLLLAVLLARGVAVAQLARSNEIPEARLQHLQQQYGAQVRAANEGIGRLQFRYPFYLTQSLGLEERKQRLQAPGSVRFDNFQGQTLVLAITGNYYASYSATLVDKNHRALETFKQVMLPLLKATVPEFSQDVPFQAFALEISHHVRGKMMGVAAENAENVVLVLPRPVAQRLVAAADTAAEQSALLEAEAFVNGEPVTLWLSEGTPPPPQPTNLFRRPSAVPPAENSLSVTPAPLVLHDSSPEGLTKLQQRYQEKLGKLVTELGSQAHFVGYAPPAFIPFRKGAYLQISLKTDLQAGVGASQYRLAALAFDGHIAHLIRSVLGYLPQQDDFDGIDFSTTIAPGGDRAMSVEFIVPVAVLRCYESYDCTGQQLINGSFVLINGERVSLDLQSAEAESRR